jgi:hypothetical protein
MPFVTRLTGVLLARQENATIMCDSKRAVTISCGGLMVEHICAPSIMSPYHHNIAPILLRRTAAKMNVISDCQHYTTE